MKLNTIQFLALSFTIGWVTGQVFKQPYGVCIFLGVLGAVIGALANDIPFKYFKNKK